MKATAVFISLLNFTALIQITFGQDHGHLNIGAVGKNQNDPLIFDQADAFETNSDYVKTLIYTNGGPYAGYYVGNITLTALAATPGHPAYASNAPAFGSWIFAQLLSVDGPSGGEFAFWESGATSPTISLASDQTSTNLWRLSESNGSAGSDPYGHIHGRRFTATKPGIYTASFRAYDLSTNGISGEPIHAPSQVLQVYFQAGVHIQTIQIYAGGTRIRFSAPAGKTWTVESSDSIGSDAVWLPVGEDVVGDDYFHEITDAREIIIQRYYRTKGT